jgi:probable phosphoglycerate mutase
LSTSGRARVVVVRHGETEWSMSGRHTSRTDLPLIDEGRRRAEGLAEALSEWTFAVVLSSPLRRARETCEIAGFASQAQIDDDLREWGYGDYEGLTTPEIRSENPDWSLWRDGCPGGEQPSEVAARTDRVLARLAAADGDGLVFAHGHVLRVLAARWLSLEAAFGARLALGAGAISVLGHERETRVIERWNRVPAG